MLHEHLEIRTMRDDPCDEVIWNQDGPIAYIQRADADLAEWTQLENLIQAAPHMLKSLLEIKELLGPDSEYCVSPADREPRGLGEMLMIGSIFERADTAIAMVQE